MLQGVRPHMIFLMGFRRSTHGGGEIKNALVHTGGLEGVPAAECGGRDESHTREVYQDITV